MDAYSRARPTLIGADKRTRGTEPVVRNIADIKTRSREGGVDSLVPGGRGVGAPSIGEGRGIGAPSIVDKRGTSPIDLGRANRSREADSGGTTVKWRPVSERMPAVDRVPERSREETPDLDARNLGRSREDAGEPAHGGGINVIGAKRGAETPAVDVIDKRSGRGVQVDRVPARPGRSEAGLSPGERGQSRSVDVITSPPARGSDTPRSYEPRARETAPRVDIAPKIDSVPRNTAPPERRVSEPPAERSRDGGVSGDRVITPQPDRNRVIDVVPKRESVPDSGNRGRSVAPPSGKRTDSLDSSSRFSATGDTVYIPRSEPSFSTRPTLVERAPSTPAYISPRPTLMDRGPSIVPSDRGVGPTVRPAGRGR
ncbi:hypothetical protein HS125_02085 [bacterium]|nr:hypothetical protein [bacterium]